MKWAIACFEHVLAYYGSEPEQILQDAIQFAYGWSEGRCGTGDLIQASRKVHAFAKTIDDPARRAVIRSIGQGVATGHMADHCIGAALYAQKAVFLAGNRISDEKTWQIEQLYLQLPDEIIELVLSTMQMKSRGLGLPEDP